MVDCGRSGPNCGMRSPRIGALSNLLPSSFWMMKLPSGFLGITRMRFGSRGLGTLMRFPALNPGSSLRPYCTVPPPWQPGMAQLTEKTLAWIEASVGASATGPPPAVSGCPFWSSPSPVPAPQAPSTSTKTAAPQRRSQDLAKRALLNQDLPANFAARKVRLTVHIEVGIARVDIRHMRSHVRRGRRSGRVINIRPLRQTHDIGGPADAGSTSMDVRRTCPNNVVSHVAGEDVARSRVEHDGSPSDGSRCIPFLSAVQRGKARSDASPEVGLPADLPATIHRGVDVEIESPREELRVVGVAEHRAATRRRAGRNRGSGIVGGLNQTDDDRLIAPMDVRTTRGAGKASKGNATRNFLRRR